MKTFIALFVLLMSTLTAFSQCDLPSNLGDRNISNSTATLTWTLSPSSVDYYNIRYRVGNLSWSYITSTNDSVKLTGLLSGAQYFWEVKTFCSDLSSSNWSSQQNFTTTGTSSCTTPSSLSLSSATNTSITVTWSNTGASSYNLRYRKNGVLNFVSNILTNSYTITGLDEGTNYEWAVKSNCGAIQSNWSSNQYSSTTTNFTCGVPTGLSSSSITTNSAIVNWTDVGSISEYRVRYRLKGQSWQYFTDIDGGSKSLTGLLEARTYQWQVRMECLTDNSQMSDFSSEKTFTTLPSITCEDKLPTNLTTSSLTFTSVTLNWDNMGAPNYSVRYRETGDLSWIYGSTSGNNYDLSGLNPSTQYDWQVASNCSVGDFEDEINWTTTSNFTTSQCSAPTSGFAVSNITNSSADIVWDGFAAPIEGYRVKYQIKGSTVITEVDVVSPMTTITSLYSGTTYRYEVATKCTADSISAYSISPVQARHQFNTTGPNACSPPSSHSYNSVTSAGFTLTWVDGGEEAYDVSYVRTGITNAPWTVETAATNSSHSVTNLDNGQKYYTRVRAVCNVSAGLISNWTSQVEIDLVGDGGCSPVSNYKDTLVTTNSATLKWDVNPDATEYNVRHRIKSTGESVWTYVNSGIPSNLYNMTGLTSDTVYYYEVRTVCGALTSSWTSPTSSFTTLSGARFGDYSSSEESLFSVYPNPTAGRINLVLPNTSPNNVLIINSLGQNVLEIWTNSLSEKIDLTQFDKGIYYIKVSNSTTTEVQGVVVE